MSEIAQTTHPRPASAFPPVLAVIPCLNEAAHIEAVARHILAEADRIPLRLVIADGGSTDGTRKFAQDLAAADNRGFLSPKRKANPKSAVNLAVQRFRCRPGVPDPHGRACGLSAALLRNASARASRNGRRFRRSQHDRQGRSRVPAAAAAAQNSILGNGGSAHRRTGEGRFIDHGHHALMRLAAFTRLRGYDETFTHNEDAELDIRLRAAWASVSGFQVCRLSPISRGPRHGFVPAVSQLRQGPGRTLFKHKSRPKLRQSVPLAVAPALLLALLTPLHPVFAAPGCGVGKRLRRLRNRAWHIGRKNVCAGFSGFAAMIMHLGWSAGFLAGALKLVPKSAAVAIAACRPPVTSAGDRMTP